ncbi:MAG: AAA family ATPase [Fibromonadales bacterium]|nr:AAA family ATPase [Fibromonadales bacterium]
MAQHISIRVPWHDDGWRGCVCANPERNQACRVLKNIAIGRADINAQQCSSCAGTSIATDEKFTPPCITESGQFMSDHKIFKKKNHPYVYDPHFNHIEETTICIEPYSFVGTPYKWTMKGDIAGNSPNDCYFTQFDSTIEIDVGSRNWVSNGINQRHIFDYFYRNIESNKSLIVAYAKAIPFIETSGRIVMGIGFVESLGKLSEYRYKDGTPTGEQATAYLWERNIKHSIRYDRSNGFLFPFAEIQLHLKNHPEQNPDDLVVFAPEEYREEFSYATEHLSHDALIQTLNKTVVVLQKYKDVRLPYGNGASWDDLIKWCKTQLENLWKERGAYPGLGAVLSALGVPFGFDVAMALKARHSDNELWDNLANALESLPELLSEELQGILSNFTKTKREDIADRIKEQLDYLKLLSRIALTLPQAKLLLEDKTRTDYRLCNYADQLTDIHCKDISADIIENPYILYEKTYRLESKYQIGINKIDLAMFPPYEPDDKRRLRAIIVSVLEREAANGSSLMLASEVATAVGKFRSDVPDIEPDMSLRTIQNERRKAFFDELFCQISIKVILENNEEREEIAIQLVRLQKINEVIREFVNNRIDSSINIQDNWEDLLKTTLKEEASSDEEQEKKARDEKISAIAKMATSRISVLTGGAGTGKTTTLAALCLSKTIQSEGILILAPTGKARVVLSSKLREQNISHKAQTLFQFLKKTKHCDINTYSFYLSGKESNETPSTVIIDECSMLTEEMFGALAETIQRAKRVIFVGDPNQLPPIGTGKPFYELAFKLKNKNNHANLSVSNRQKQSDTLRLDVELSKMFTEDLAGCVRDDLFEQMAKDSKNIEFIHCKDEATLPNVIEETLAKINITDTNSFDESLGGKLDEYGMNFPNVKSIDDWQILSPYRNSEVLGTRNINAFVQQRYRLSDPGKRKKHILHLAPTEYSLEKKLLISKIKIGHQKD